MENLEIYLAKRMQEFENLRREIKLLRGAKMPLRVRENSKGFQLFSEDYSLATSFIIQKRSEYLGGTSGYDGGYSINRYETYPQFYFDLKSRGLVKPVYIQHDGFGNDTRMVIKSVTQTLGWKDFSDMNSQEDNKIELEKVYEFFRQSGVKPILMDRLEKRIKEAKEL